ncbi:hypothetical protein KGQ71_04665, partial [Patescibacteria group bacterium]|nr:hypothetical protein [Patescibacteria group bacterium]
MDIPPRHLPSSQFLKKSGTLVFTLILVSALFYFQGVDSVIHAASVTSLQQQKAALEQQAKQDQYLAEQNKSIADRASDRMNQLQGDITATQNILNDTQGQIDATTAQIGEQQQKKDELQSQLTEKQNQGGAIVRALYIYQTSHPDLLQAFANQPLSQREEELAQLGALEKAAQQMAKQISDQQAVVQATLDGLNQQQ